jgi:hypothetical protein
MGADHPDFARAKELTTGFPISAQTRFAEKQKNPARTPQVTEYPFNLSI